MRLPFSQSDFFAVFERYNVVVWPAQLLLYLLAIVAVVLAFRRTREASRGVYAILAVFWIWMGVVYHAGFFAAINPLARFMAAVFLLQGAVFVSLAVRRKPAVISPENGFNGWMGGSLIAIGLVIYPILNIAAGHAYPALPSFGLPCPTTIFTLGIMIWGLRALPASTFIIPLLWTGVGTSAALQLGVPEDLTLLVAMFGSVAAIAWHELRHMMNPPEFADETVKR